MGIGGIVRPGLHVEGWCLGYGSMWAPRNERMGGGLRTGCKEPNWSGGGGQTSSCKQVHMGGGWSAAALEGLSCDPRAECTALGETGIRAHCEQGPREPEWWPSWGEEG